jgi:nucleoside phosphorylase/BarA-like signal transduction histidine kinase
MVKILLVEDDTEKLRDISETLEKAGINSDLVDHAVDYQTALKFLKSTLYDLLILDIAIPIRKSEKIDLEGGVKLLQEILQRDIVMKPSYIIGLTALDFEFTNAAKQFDDQTIKVIKYSDSNIEWQTKLINCIEQRTHVKSAITNQQPIYEYDVAIITAVEVEFNAVMALSDNWIKLTHPVDPSPYFETIIEGNGKKFKVVAVCANQMGMNASSVFSMKLIYNFRPKYLFMVGIAASLKDAASHGFGDILVVDESWDGGAGKLTQSSTGVTEFNQTALHLRLNSDISEKARGYKSDKTTLRKIKDGWKYGAVPNTELSLHLGSVTSVAGVIENEAIIKKLKDQDRKLLGVEMESYGVYFAAQNCGNPRPIAIVIKSISDFANSEKNDIYQTYASYTSASFMFEFLTKELSPL